jgi:hypothetical protein
VNAKGAALTGAVSYFTGAHTQLGYDTLSLIDKRTMGQTKKDWFFFYLKRDPNSRQMNRGPRWTVPVCGGAGKIVHLEKLPVNIHTQLWPAWNTETDSHRYGALREENRMQPT